MATEQVETAVGAHLVGGMKAPDAETAMSTAGAILGRHLYAVTDLPAGSLGLRAGCRVFDTALDDPSTFARAGGLVALGAVLWLVNRLVEGPHDEVEADRLRG